MVAEGAMHRGGPILSLLHVCVSKAIHINSIRRRAKCGGPPFGWSPIIGKDNPTTTTNATGAGFIGGRDGQTRHVDWDRSFVNPRPKKGAQKHAQGISNCLERKTLELSSKVSELR